MKFRMCHLLSFADLESGGARRLSMDTPGIAWYSWYQNILLYRQSARSRRRLYTWSHAAARRLQK